MRLLIALLAVVASAQTSGSITAPVSRTVSLIPDEAAFDILLSGAIDTTPQQMKQVLQAAGMPNPTLVATGLAGPGRIYYHATATVPAASAIGAAKALDSLRIHPPDPLNTFIYSVAFSPSQAAIDTMRQTLLPQLLDESRRQAQSLASAAGVRLGPIRSISDTAGSSGYGYALGGDFSQVYDPLTYAPMLFSNAQVTFYLNVVFATAP